MKKMICCIAVIGSLLSCNSTPEEVISNQETEPFYEYYDAEQTQLKSIGNYKPGAEKERKTSAAGLQLLETYHRDEILQACQASGLDSLANVLDPTTNTGSFGDHTATIFTFNNENRLKFQQHLEQHPEILKLFPADMKFMWSAKGEESSNAGRPDLKYTLYAVRNSGQNINSADIAETAVGKDPNYGLMTVNITMTADGTAKWAKMTADNLERAVAITAGGVVFSAPVVKGKISAGATQISGNFTVAEAEELNSVISHFIFNGEWRSYHKNGKLKEIRQYLKGERTGAWSRYDETGKLIKKSSSH